MNLVHVTFLLDPLSSNVCSCHIFPHLTDCDEAKNFLTSSNIQVQSQSRSSITRVLSRGRGGHPQHALPRRTPGQNPVSTPDSVAKLLGHLGHLGVEVLSSQAEPLVVDGLGLVVASPTLGEGGAHDDEYALGHVALAELLEVVRDGHIGGLLLNFPVRLGGAGGLEGGGEHVALTGVERPEVGLLILVLRELRLRQSQQRGQGLADPGERGQAGLGGAAVEQGGRLLGKVDAVEALAHAVLEPRVGDDADPGADAELLDELAVGLLELREREAVELGVSSVGAVLAGHEVGHARGGGGPDQWVLDAVAVEGYGDDDDVLAPEDGSQGGLVGVVDSVDLGLRGEAGGRRVGAAENGDMMTLGQEGGKDRGADVAGGSSDDDVAEGVGSCHCMVLILRRSSLG